MPHRLCTDVLHNNPAQTLSQSLRKFHITSSSRNIVIDALQSTTAQMLLQGLCKPYTTSSSSNIIDFRDHCTYVVNDPHRTYVHSTPTTLPLQQHYMYPTSQPHWIRSKIQYPAASVASTIRIFPTPQEIVCMDHGYDQCHYFHS